MKYSLLIVVSFLFTFSFAQPNIQWQKCYGSLTNDAITDVINAHNVGYISCGSTNGCAGGSLDAWIIRTDNAGNILWQKCYVDQEVISFSLYVRQWMEDMFLLEQAPQTMVM